jgi:hypothetical protein
MQTPNFVMNTTDVDSMAQPTERRFPRHQNGPQTILFDAVYAGAILHNFGTHALPVKIELAASWQTSSSQMESRLL